MAKDSFLHHVDLAQYLLTAMRQLIEKISWASQIGPFLDNCVTLHIHTASVSRLLM